MTQKLTWHGENWVLVIDPPILGQMRIDPESASLEIEVKNGALVVSPSQIEETECRAQFDAALKTVNRKYGNALRKLAE